MPFLPLLLLPFAGVGQTIDEFYGTSHPFASEAIYFALTDCVYINSYCDCGDDPETSPGTT